MAKKEECKTVSNAIRVHRQSNQNLTLASGHRPALKPEKNIMFGTHPSLLPELVNAVQRERTERINQSALIAEATRGRVKRPGIVRSLRHGFGAGIIGIGYKVRGQRPEGLDLSESAGAGSLRIAR